MKKIKIVDKSPKEKLRIWLKEFGRRVGEHRKIPNRPRAKINFRRLIFYIKIWIKMSKNAFLIVLSHKTVFLIFLIGKILRFGFFAGFIYFVVKGAENLAGYNMIQVIFFFLTFNLIDVSAQFFYREVYRFRPLLISGDFDLVLVKPINALFRVLMGGADVIDLATIPLLLLAIFYVGEMFNPSTVQIVYYIALIINGLLIATAFHIAVISLGIITLEIDHTIMIYRDLTNLGRFPVDIYKQPLKEFLTYIVPVAIMITLPTKAFMGLVSVWGVIFSFVFGVGVLLLSTRIWNLALRKYTSASS